MAYCSKCGKEIPEDTQYCPGCGSAVNAPANGPEPRSPSYEREETGVFLWGFLAFILALFTFIGGLILCIILYATGKPKSGFAALVGGVLIPIIFTIIGLVIFFVILGGAVSQESFIGFF